MYTNLVIAPETEPISLTEAKLHLRLVAVKFDADYYDIEDGKLQRLIVSAREYVEHHTRRALITQTWDMVIDEFPAGWKIKLPYPEHQSVSSISYTDEAGQAANFTDFDLKAIPGYIKKRYGFSWPSIYPESDITIRFVCGYVSAAAVPASIKQAMLLLIGHFYENEEQVSLTSWKFEKLPLGVDSLLAPYRRFEF